MTYEWTRDILLLAINVLDASTSCPQGRDHCGQRLLSESLIFIPPLPLPRLKRCCSLSAPRSFPLFRMCDPRWIYGLPIDNKALNEYAIKNAPDCVREGDISTIAIVVIEKFERHFGHIFVTEVAIDVFDEKFEPKLVLIIHQEHPGSTKLRLEDENYIREVLGIREHGKWYRYFGAFHRDDLEDYKKHAAGLGPNPSRADSAGELPIGGSREVVHLLKSLAAASI